MRRARYCVLSSRIIQAYRDRGRISDAHYKRHPRATIAAQDMDILDAAQASLFSTAKESGANETVRLNFTTEYVSWTTDDCKTVHFPDESPFTTRWDQKQRLGVATAGPNKVRSSEKEAAQREQRLQAMSENNRRRRGNAKYRANEEAKRRRRAEDDHEYLERRRQQQREYRRNKREFSPGYREFKLDQRR
ncbi:hypothetical protein HPB49_008956 [Dermacentor silvarum]|uniref:Uncharacterized protein n=1 Tax=Dermacentor silvarum TaxID=543639 RepID=A0ACB8DY29_DERSI|nr:hypothetical protein HPB49_008956 [Dermacentor silvarum]